MAENSKGIWAQFRREPLVHFLVLAAILFAANALAGRRDQETIAVDVATQDYLLQRRQELAPGDKTEAEKAAIIEEFIEQELLVREARKQGLDDSSRIRALLVKNMRFLIAGEIADPDDEELQILFQKTVDRYTRNPALTFDHAFYSNPKDAPADALKRLRAGESHLEMGDTTSRLATLTRIDDVGAETIFGPDQAASIMKLDDKKWHGPFVSKNGVHYLRNSKVHPAPPPNFEDAKEWLKQEWILARSREIIDQKVSEIRKEYRILIEVPEKVSP